MPWRRRLIILRLLLLWLRPHSTILLVWISALLAYNLP
jgi:hypothetical protein